MCRLLAYGWWRSRNRGNFLLFLVFLFWFSFHPCTISRILLPFSQKKFFFFILFLFYKKVSSFHVSHSLFRCRHQPPAVWSELFYSSKPFPIQTSSSIHSKKKKKSERSMDRIYFMFIANLSWSGGKRCLVSCTACLGFEIRFSIEEKYRTLFGIPVLDHNWIPCWSSTQHMHKHCQRRLRKS